VHWRTTRPLRRRNSKREWCTGEPRDQKKKKLKEGEFSHQKKKKLKEGEFSHQKKKKLKEGEFRNPNGNLNQRLNLFKKNCKPRNNNLIFIFLPPE